MWLRTSGEIIQWMISAIQEVPWLSFESKVSKLPSAWNSTVSSTFLTAESFISVLTDQKIKIIISFLIFWYEKLRIYILNQPVSSI